MGLTPRQATLILAALAALDLAGCATSGVKPPELASTSSSAEGRAVLMEPVRVQANPDPLTGLETFDAGDLLERANALFDGKEFDHSIKVYERLVEVFPTSSLVPSALYNAGLAFEQLEQHGLALERYQRVIKSFPDSTSAKDAYYRQSLCLSKLRRWKEVADAYWAIRQRGELTAMDELEARVGMAIAMFMQDDYATAEREFMSAVRFYESKTKDQYLPADYWVAQARFYLGEINARQFEALKLDPPEGDTGAWAEKMGRKLEEKCDLLLRAQNNFIRTIRVGHTGWATAAGFRIGSLYERLYDDLLSVPVPPAFDDEAKEYYRKEVRQRIAVLVSKAVQIYERSLDMAERVGEKNEWVERTARSLERMKTLALESIRG